MKKLLIAGHILRYKTEKKKTADAGRKTEKVGNMLIGQAAIVGVER